MARSTTMTTTTTTTANSRLHRLVRASGQMNHKVKSFCNEIESLLFARKLFHSSKYLKYLPSRYGFTVNITSEVCLHKFYSSGVIVRNVQIYFQTLHN